MDGCRALSFARSYQEIQRTEEGCAERDLPNADQQLRELESDGLIDRKVFPVVPPHVEYSLSEKGRTLKPILLVLHDWGKSYV